MKSGRLITHQLKPGSYNGSRSVLQNIEYSLTSTIKGKYADATYINGFIEFLTIHVFNQSASSMSEGHISQLHMPLLYAIFIIKNYVYKDFSISDIDSSDRHDEIKHIMNNMVQAFNDKCEEHYFDIYRYLMLYDKISSDKYTLL